MVNSQTQLIEKYEEKANKILKEMQKLLQKRQQQVDDYKHSMILNKLEALQK